MSRLNNTKINRFVNAYMDICVNDTAYSGLYTSGSTTFGTAFKGIALCSLDKANEGQTGTNKINKQEFYCCLFCMGFPLGLIAKTLLNANLAPVRNAVLLYKLPVIAYIKHTNQQTFLERYYRSMPSGSSRIDLIKNFVAYCGFIGGLPLIDKLVAGLDQEALFIRENISGFRMPFAQGAGFSELQFWRAEWEQANGRRRGAVRRTGLTTSRVAATPQTTVQAVQSSTPTQPVTVSTNSLSTPEADAVTGSATRQSRQLVRDVPIDITTFGIEIEGSFITDGLDSLKKPASMNFIEYMKKIVDEAQYPAKEYKKDMTLKREGTLSMKSEGSDTPTGKVCWSYKYDGSVHGGQENREIVSPILRGENGIKQMKIICSAMRRSGFYSNATAGVHVHLGAAGLSLDTFKNICWNYTGFEPLIDMMFPSDRRWSNAYFAESFSSISNFAQKLDRANSFADLTNYSGIMGGGRYWKVNLQAFNSLGTIEFRQCIGTNDDRLITWFLYYCFYLMEASKRKRLTNFNLKNLQDILPTWAFTYFIDRVRSVSGYDIKYGYDIGSRGSTGTVRNTNTRGGDPMGTPLNTSRGNQKSRRGGWNQRSGNNDIFD